ncbi:MAG TPA: molybdopterin molybdotransferase MoeA, partial [Puia sp.]
MIQYTDALERVLSKAHSFGTETIPLEHAFGRILTGAVYADRDYPPFDRATMDGYALRSDDLRQGMREFKIIETIFAGDVVSRQTSPGDCYKIMTGAAVPAGMDVVIRREDATETEGAARLQAASARTWLNVARKGEDLHKGDVVVDRPCICEPPIIGLLASLGQRQLTVARLPRIALLTTGNEVVPVDAEAGPVQIRNSNRWLLQAFLKKWQIDLWHYQHVPDDRDRLRE